MTKGGNRDSGQYFTASPAGRSRPGEVTVATRGRTFRLGTDAGVFSFQRLDPGTRVLLDHVPMPEHGSEDDVLDLGCGYGPIACTLALSCPSATIWAVDVNERALGLVRDNASALGTPGVLARAPDDVPPDARFRLLYSNPPIRIGKQALHELLLRWLARLTPDGRAYLVVQRNLGADSLAGWLTGQGYPTERLASQRGYRVLAVAPATATG